MRILLLFPHPNYLKQVLAANFTPVVNHTTNMTNYTKLFTEKISKAEYYDDPYLLDW